MIETMIALALMAQTAKANVSADLNKATNDAMVASAKAAGLSDDEAAQTAADSSAKQKEPESYDPSDPLSRAIIDSIKVQGLENDTWIQIGRSAANDKALMRVRDMQSISTSGLVWMKLAFAAGKVEVTRDRIDCHAETITTTYMTIYKPDGALDDSFEITPDKQHVLPVTPDSLGQIEWRSACKTMK